MGMMFSDLVPFRMAIMVPPFAASTLVGDHGIELSLRQTSLINGNIIMTYDSSFNFNNKLYPKGYEQAEIYTLDDGQTIRIILS